MISFWATVHLDATVRKSDLVLGAHYRPLFRFQVDGLQDELWGLAELKETDWPFAPGETKLARFGIYGFPKLSELLAEGVRFTLQEGRQVVGSGIIDEIEYNEIDATS